MHKLSNFSCYDISSKYTVGCTGQTVYVYDADKKEVARFKTLKYAYQCLFSPDEKTLAVRSNCGQIVIYDMNELRLVYKFRYGKDGQDGGFCFSPGGEKIYIIEDVVDEEHMYARLVSYDTATYNTKTVEFENKEIQLLNVAPGKTEDEVYMSGYMRGIDGLGQVNFILNRVNGEIVGIRYIENTYSVDNCSDGGRINYKYLSEVYKKTVETKSGFGSEIRGFDECRIYCRLHEIREILLQIRDLVRTPKELKNSIYMQEKKELFDRLCSAICEVNEKLRSSKCEEIFREINRDNLEGELKKVWDICGGYLKTLAEM